MLFWITLAVLLIGASSFAALVRGVGRLPRLAASAPWAEAPAPRVSIIVAARNEARGIDQGLRSLLAQDYPNLEIVVVDDRSTDDTPAIIARLAAEHRRLVPVRVEALPDGWLGKNHALFLGAERSSGDWLLFTDADVVMAPDTVARAVGWAEAAERDHLAVMPALELPGALLQAFAMYFGASFLLFTRAWRASNPRSREFIGVGAFNLVRRSWYLRAGTHRRIALRPDDDLKLGKILKQSGARQELLDGVGCLRVEWYRTIGELIRGLEKNAFAGLDYRVTMAVVGVAAQALLVAAPYVALVMGAATTRILGGIAVLVAAAGFATVARNMGIRASRALLYPIVGILFIFIVIRTTTLNLVQGGIRWRDTFYPLALLKTNRV